MEDTVYRRDAINAVSKWFYDVFGIKKSDETATIFKRLRELPSAQSDVSDINDGDTVSRQAAIKAFDDAGFCTHGYIVDVLEGLPSAQPEEVIPHRNYKCLSDYWCECGWHLGKKGEVKYCSECGRKVNWDE